MYSWLDDALNDGGIVLTSNRRLARELRGAFDENQLSIGRDSWLTPEISSLSGWLQHLLDNAILPQAPPLRIDAYSSSILWERCLLQHSDEQVLNFAGVVRQATRSWQRLHDWRVPLGEVQRTAHSRDEQLFAQAAWSYQKLLRSENWTDSAGLHAEVSNLIESGSLRLPSRITMAGFDRVTPAVEYLLGQISCKGCVVAGLPQGESTGSVQLGCFPDTASELRTAGAWARAELLKCPDSRVAIVSATLEQEAAATTHLIREGFVPGWQYGGPEHQTAVNVSYGRRLADFPLIAAALDALRWAGTGLPTREMAALIKNPFLAGEVHPERVRLELKLREIPDRYWSPGDLRNLLHAPNRDTSESGWATCENSLKQLTKLGKQERNVTEWAARIDQVLNEIQWPGIAQQDSIEFQLVNRWRELLNQFAATEQVQARVNLKTAVRHISAMASEVIYQPETSPGTLQVIGKLEAAGMEFDKLWVCGLDASNWPASSSPSPLISRHLQRKYEMPDATPGDTLEYSRRSLERLKASAGEVMLSWSQTNKDTELTPSPLLDEFETVSFTDVVDPGWHAATLMKSGKLSVIDCDPVPAILPGEQVAGGAYTVQLHSIEPFAAFAAGRLRVGSVRRIETGLSAGLRGSLIHQALHSVYRACPSRDDIRQWSDQDAKLRITEAVAGALAQQRKNADEVTGRLLDLEQPRLVDLIGQFLIEERAREAFAVAAVERSIRFERYGVSLGLRVDRIDRLADGSMLIIDYKTGARKSVASREGEPNDLQLVVYSCAAEGPVGGLALVNLDSRAISYSAVGSGVEWRPMDAELWPQRLADWQGLVDRALQEIAAGDVRLNLRLQPAEGRALNPLSRLEEHRLEQ